SRIEELEQTNARLEGMVNSDPLTGLLNRRGLEIILARETAYAKRTKATLLAALIDLDNFKTVNDSYGYDVGDKVLKAVAQTLKETIRGSDWCSRVGGDEFLILLPATHVSDGIVVLNRVRMSIADKTVEVSARELIHTTVSIGIAQIATDTKSIEEILTVTGSLLRFSKCAGKNRISAAGAEAAVSNETIDLSNSAADTLDPPKSAEIRQLHEGLSNALLN
ncbi:MAG: GGDEF domain-containing protein, partial [Cyanobacteria bacterium]|nr:GGDEF domain-containing protein [Cyanobacteriota bacterium]